MILSMTGFGRGVVELTNGRLIVDIQSVNRKYLEISASLPKEMGHLESDLRKWIGEKISRGQLTVRLQWFPSPKAMQGLFPQEEMLFSVKTQWEKLCDKLNLPKQQVDLKFLLEMIPSISKESPFEDVESLKECVDKALMALCDMQRQEGKMLAQDLQDRLHELQKHMEKIEEIAPEIPPRMRQKLEEKLRAVCSADLAFDDKLIREMFLFAEKVDITEEIVRLKSHFAQFKECLHVKGSIGKKMEFIIQEIGREINTIGSKAADAKISYLVVEMKTELEKMREQVQNIA